MTAGWESGATAPPEARFATSHSSVDATHLAIRVWSSTGAALDWASQSTLVYMLSDLIAASGGTLAEDSGVGLVARFEQPSEALRAAKRVQWSVLEFSQQLPEQCFGAAIAIYHAGDLPDSNQNDVVQGIVELLEQAKPSQIFITPNAAKLLQGIPGLLLRKCTGPFVVAGGLERGAHELVWATPQTHRHMLKLLKQAARKVRPKTASRIASEPTVELSRSSILQIPADKNHPNDAADMNPGIAAPVQEKRPSDTGMSPSASNLLWWSLPVVGLLIVVGALFFLTQSSEKQTAPVTPTAIPPTSSNSTPERVDPAPVRKVNEYEGFSEKDIPIIIRMAESDVRAGNYANARREYDIVLRLDPTSVPAKVGLRALHGSEHPTR